MDNIDEVINELIKLRDIQPLDLEYGKKKYELKEGDIFIVHYEGPRENISNSVYWKGDFVYLSRSSDSKNFIKQRNCPGDWEDIINNKYLQCYEETREINIEKIKN